MPTDFSRPPARDAPDLTSSVRDERAPLRRSSDCHLQPHRSRASGRAQAARSRALWRTVCRPFRDGQSARRRHDLRIARRSDPARRGQPIARRCFCPPGSAAACASVRGASARSLVAVRYSFLQRPFAHELLDLDLGSMHPRDDEWPEDSRRLAGKALLGGTMRPVRRFPLLGFVSRGAPRCCDEDHVFELLSCVFETSKITIRAYKFERARCAFA